MKVWIVEFSKADLNDGERVFSSRGKAVDYIKDQALRMFGVWTNFSMNCSEDIYMDWTFTLCLPDGTKTEEWVSIQEYEVV